MRLLIAIWLLIASVLLVPSEAFAAKRLGKVVGIVVAAKVVKRLGPSKIPKKPAKATTNKALQQQPDRVAQVSTAKYPQSAKHIEDAQKAGKPDTITLDRSLAKANRRDALKGTPTKPGKDRDEYPPAFSQEGGKGASVRHIDPKDNRASGACIGQQCRGLPDGARVQIKITP